MNHNKEGHKKSLNFSSNLSWEDLSIDNKQSIIYQQMNHQYFFVSA